MRPERSTTSLNYSSYMHYPSGIKPLEVVETPKDSLYQTAMDTTNNTIVMFSADSIDSGQREALTSNPDLNFRPDLSMFDHHSV